MHQRSQSAVYSPAAWAVAVAVACLVVALQGCRPAGPGGGATPAPAPPVERPEAPKGETVADPVLREARAQADAILGGLLAGTFDDDPDLGPVARKLKGYRFHSIKSQEVTREGSVDFEGTLSGPAGRARMALFLVRQSDGRWAVGTFSGPDPE